MGEKKSNKGNSLNFTKQDESTKRTNTEKIIRCENINRFRR